MLAVNMKPNGYYKNTLRNYELISEGVFYDDITIYRTLLSNCKMYLL